MPNITLNLQFSSAIIELVEKLVISNMNNKFGKDTWKKFLVIVPQVNVNAAEFQLQWPTFFN